MNNIIKELEVISLKEQLEHEGWNSSMIESMIDSVNNSLESSIICNTEEELHSAIQFMSSEKGSV